MPLRTNNPLVRMTPNAGSTRSPAELPLGRGAGGRVGVVGPSVRAPRSKKMVRRVDERLGAVSRAC